MAENKFDRNFVTQLKQNIPGTDWHPKVEAAAKGKSGRILFLDSEMVPGACYTEAVWIRNANSEVMRKGGIQAHTHGYDEVLGFFGTNPDDPYDLGAEIEFWLGDEKNILTKTCLIFVPKGLIHCPLRVLNVKTPVIHFSNHTGKMYATEGQVQPNTGSQSPGKTSAVTGGKKYSKYIITELKQNVVDAPWGPPMPPVAKGKTGRVLWLDNEVVEGGYYVECVWIYPRKDNSERRGTKAHTHDYGEVLAFFSSDPDNPHELGAEAEFWIEDEKHIINTSCLAYVPAGIRHSPLRFNRIDRPVFHFTLGHGKMYF